MNSTRSLPISDGDRLRQRNRELSILNAIAKELNAQLSLDRALQVALTQVARLLDLQAGWVWLLREDSGNSYLAATLDLPPALADSPEHMEGTCYCLDTFRAGDLAGAANVNVVTCSRLKNLVDGTDGLRYHASIPLYAHGKQLGVLNVASTDWRELSQEDLQLLYTVGDLLGIAVERARLFARSAQLGALEERNRLARELHDTLAQGLTAIALTTRVGRCVVGGRCIPSSRPRRPSAARLAWPRPTWRTRGAPCRTCALRRWKGEPLSEALAALAQDIEAQAGVQVSFEPVGAARPLSPRVESGLFRIAQEALNNVVQHARASHVLLRLAMTPDAASLRVSDDGVGFRSRPSTRWAFRPNRSERARSAAGWPSIAQDQPGRGHVRRGGRAVVHPVF